MIEDLVVRAVLFVVMAGTGVLLLWLARAAASGRLKRNQFAGIRTASTLASDEAWLAAHQRAERSTMWAGWSAILAGAVALLAVSQNVMFWAVIVGSVVILGFVIHGAVVGTRAARAVTD